MTIYEKLKNIQNELKAPKNLYNSFGKYSYRNAESILEALKPLESKWMFATVINDEIMSIDGRFYVKSTVTVYDVESDSSISVSAYAREEETKKGMDASQITGATSSYARKYALNGMFLLDDTKDTDSEEYQSKSRATNNTQPKPHTVIKPVEKAVICERCNKPIAIADGHSVKAIVETSKAKYGKCYCMNCLKELKDNKPVEPELPFEI